MKNIITITLVGLAVILFIFLVSYGVKNRNIYPKPFNQETWKFGNWEEDQEKPIKNVIKLKHDQQGQINATSYKEAVQLSKEKDMSILIFFHADWCHFCHRMEKEVFTDNEVKSNMQKFIFLKTNFDQEEKLVKKYNVRGLPYFIIIDKKESVQKKESGYKKPKEFIKFLDMNE